MPPPAAVCPDLAAWVTAEATAAATTALIRPLPKPVPDGIASNWVPVTGGKSFPVGRVGLDGLIHGIRFGLPAPAEQHRISLLHAPGQEDRDDYRTDHDRARGDQRGRV